MLTTPVQWITGTCTRGTRVSSSASKICELTSACYVPGKALHEFIEHDHPERNHQGLATG
jgi:hypothetical protein